MDWKPDICVYHGNCDDGFGAANTMGLVKHLSEIMRDKWGMEHHGGKDFDPELSN